MSGKYSLDEVMIIRLTMLLDTIDEQKPHHHAREISLFSCWPRESKRYPQTTYAIAIALCCLPEIGGPMVVDTLHTKHRG